MEFGYLCQERLLAILVLCELISFIVERSLEEGLNLEGIVFFSEGQNHPLAFLIADHNGDALIISHNAFDFAEGLKVGDELVHSVKDLHEVLV